MHGAPQWTTSTMEATGSCRLGSGLRVQRPRSNPMGSQRDPASRCECRSLMDEAEQRRASPACSLVRSTGRRFFRSRHSTVRICAGRYGGFCAFSGGPRRRGAAAAARTLDRQGRSSERRLSGDRASLNAIGPSAGDVAFTIGSHTITLEATDADGATTSESGVIGIVPGQW